MLYGTQNPHGGDVYTRPLKLDFSANINPLGTPDGVIQAVQDSITQLSHYPDPYCRELIQAISDFEGLPKETILCGSGAAELIFSYCAALHPRKALLLAPTFCEYQNALQAAGCETETYYLRAQDGFSLTEGFLQSLQTTDAELLLLCNPNNPTGLPIEQGLMEEILLLCKKRNIRLFVDECFLDLTENGKAFSLTGKLAQFPGLLILKAFTKSYGMAGLRLGYCLSADGDLLSAMSRQAQPWNVSIPAQMAGAAALKETAFLEKACHVIHAERPRLLRELKRIGLRPIPSKANFILFYSKQPLFSPLLEKGIQLRDCGNYPGLGPGWYRMAVKLPEENTQLLKALEEILRG